MEGEQETRQSKFKRICVFCGSSQGKKRSYQDAAVELGKELVRSRISSSLNLLVRALFLAVVFFSLAEYLWLLLAAWFLLKF